MKKDIKAATIQELNEMISVLQGIKKSIISNKTDAQAENFVTDEIDKVYYSVKSLDERLTYCFK